MSVLLINKPNGRLRNKLNRGEGGSSGNWEDSDKDNDSRREK
jgi:hypothetical protein